MEKIIIASADKEKTSCVELALQELYQVQVVDEWEELLCIMRKQQADLICLSTQITAQPGYGNCIDFLKHVHHKYYFQNVPTVVICGLEEPDIEDESLSLGVKDVLMLPLNKRLIQRRVAAIIEVEALHKRLQKEEEDSNRQMENVILQAITTMANTVDAKDDYTGEHSIRVAAYAASIAMELGWAEEDVKNIHYLGLLHDIGKISVPDMIIRKPGALSETEWRTMKSHTTIGADILKGIHIVNKASEVALYHHEWYNGGGYPSKLAGEDIPIEARIVCVADAYDAMTSNRVYRSALSEERVKQEFIKGRGTQFDPELVDLLLRMLEKNRLNIFEEAYGPVSQKHIDAAQESNQLLYKFMEMNNTHARREAMKDALTGLYNRNYAELQINDCLSENPIGVYIMIDLDNFKHVNDLFGHMEGDTLLKHVAEIIVRHVPENSIACRIGGDEFSVFLSGAVQKQDIEDIVISILNDYNKLVAQSERYNHTSLSVGIAIVPEDGTNYFELYNAADKALYFAKRNGKNRYYFYGDDITPITNDREMVIDIRQLEQLIHDRRSSKGSYQVEYEEFQRIYNFISRCVERTKQNVILLMVSLQNESQVDAAELEEEMVHLEEAVAHSLRRNDVSARYSSSQLLVILVDTIPGNVKIILNRIMNRYESKKSKGYFVTYEQMQVDGNHNL